MTFEEVLPKMRQGYEIGLEKTADIDVYRINNGELERLRSDGEWFSTFLDSREILSNDWYVRREG